MVFSYDFGLVALSIFVAIFGSFTGLVLTTGLNRASRARLWLRIILGAIAIGGSIWSMHFIAMLAVKLPIKLSYDVGETAASALIAVLFTGIALYILCYRKFGDNSLIVSGFVMGSAIASMHYLGMYAVRGNCVLMYSWLGVAISIAIAIQASGVALWFAARKRGVMDTLFGAVGLGLSIAAMHYSAMEATSFIPATSVIELVSPVLSEFYMALSIAVTIYVIWSVCLFVYAYQEFRETPV